MLMNFYRTLDQCRFLRMVEELRECCLSSRRRRDLGLTIAEVTHKQSRRSLLRRDDERSFFTD